MKAQDGGCVKWLGDIENMVTLVLKIVIAWCWGRCNHETPRHEGYPPAWLLRTTQFSGVHGNQVTTQHGREGLTQPCLVARQPRNRMPRCAGRRGYPVCGASEAAKLPRYEETMLTKCSEFIFVVWLLGGGGLNTGKPGGEAAKRRSGRAGGC